MKSEVAHPQFFRRMLLRPCLDGRGFTDISSQVEQWSVRLLEGFFNLECLLILFVKIFPKDQLVGLWHVTAEVFAIVELVDHL